MYRGETPRKEGDEVVFEAMAKVLMVRQVARYVMR
jgi:hypothetical protein